MKILTLVGSAYGNMNHDDWIERYPQPSFDHYLSGVCRAAMIGYEDNYWIPLSSATHPFASGDSEYHPRLVVKSKVANSSDLVDFKFDFTQRMVWARDSVEGIPANDISENSTEWIKWANDCDEMNLYQDDNTKLMCKTLSTGLKIDNSIPPDSTIKIQLEFRYPNIMGHKDSRLAAERIYMHPIETVTVLDDASCPKGTKCTLEDPHWANSNYEPWSGGEEVFLITIIFPDCRITPGDKFFGSKYDLLPYLDADWVLVSNLFLELEDKDYLDGLESALGRYVYLFVYIIITGISGVGLVTSTLLKVKSSKSAIIAGKYEPLFDKLFGKDHH